MSSGGMDRAPGQQLLKQKLGPVIRRVGLYGEDLGQQPYLGVPQMGGQLSGIPMYDVPQFNIPQPTSGWFDSMSPEIKQGLYEPYNESGRQMLELMGSRGQVGSGSSGYTGAAGVALGELGSRAGRDVGMNAWNMMAPNEMMANQAMWGAELARNQTGYNAATQEAMMDYGGQMEAWRMPFSMASQLYPASIPGGQASTGSPIGNALSGGLMGGVAGSMIPASMGLGGWGLVGGAALGALGGVF